MCEKTNYVSISVSCKTQINDGNITTTQIPGVSFLGVTENEGKDILFFRHIEMDLVHQNGFNFVILKADQRRNYSQVK